MRFGYLHSQHRRRKVTPRGHPIPDLVQIVLQILLKTLDAASVHPGGTLGRRPHRRPGVVHLGQPPKPWRHGPAEVVMPDPRSKFEPEHQKGAVRIDPETGKPSAQIARDLGVHPKTRERVSEPKTMPNTKEHKGGRPATWQNRSGRAPERPTTDGPRWSKTTEGPVDQTRQRSERGPLRADQEDHAPRAAHRDLRDLGDQHLVVLQVDSSRAHPAGCSPRRPGRAGARAVQGLEAHLRLAVHHRRLPGPIVMLASTVTASRSTASTELGAAAVIGYVSSRLAAARR